VTEPWPRLPREAVESPSLEIFQTHLDAVLCSLLWVTLLGQGGLDRVTHRGPFQPLPSCDSVTGLGSLFCTHAVIQGVVKLWMLCGSYREGSLLAPQGRSHRFAV